MISNAAETAYNKGYRIRGNNVISPRGAVRKLKKTCAYPKFTVKIKGVAVAVKCHQLAAWQKFGVKCRGKHIVVRHKDDDASNFRLSNIELGTKEDNVNDRYVNLIIREWMNQMDNTIKRIGGTIK